MSYGTMVPLKSALENSERIKMMDLLHKDDSCIELNYEGTLAFTNYYSYNDDYYKIKRKQNN